jgi:hypothetical protein
LFAPKCFGVNVSLIDKQYTQCSNPPSIAMKEGIHVASNWTICVVWWAVSTLPIHIKHVQFALVSVLNATIPNAEFSDGAEAT